MVDRNTKRKLKRLWQSRILLGLGFLATIGSSVAGFQAMQTYQTPEPQWLLNAAHHVEIVKDCNRSFWEREQSLEQLKEIRAQKLPQRIGLIQFNQNGDITDFLELNLEACSNLMASKKVEQSLFFLLGMLKITPQSPQVAMGFGKTNVSLYYSSTGNLIQTSDPVSKFGEEVLAALAEYPERSRKFTQAAILLGLSAVFGLILLWFFLRQCYASPLPFTGQLICFLPEECIAELEVLRKRLIQQQQPKGLIRLIIMANFLHLLWAFYIQIRLDNLSLPKGSTKRIDDE